MGYTIGEVEEKMSRSNILYRWMPFSLAEKWVCRAKTNGGQLLRAIPLLIITGFYIILTIPVWFVLIIWEVIDWLRQEA